MTTTKRDLDADLAICNAATSGPWRIKGVNIIDGRGYPVLRKEPMGRAYGGGDATLHIERIDANAAFAIEARTGWPIAIERAINAEAEVESLRMQRDSLEATLQHYRGYA